MSNDIAHLTEIYEKHRNSEQAGPMESYMKNHFAFLGIKSPERTQLEKQFFQESGLLKRDFDHAFIEQLWEKGEREYQYTALAYIEKSLKKLTAADLPLIEKLITTKSWWDTVDALAAKAVGKIANQYPETISETIAPWAEHDNLWLRRTAILFQLKFKGNTDEGLLYSIILKNNDSKEFFIQKAIGWALREYSKTNPASVGRFLASHPLMPLSVREASKYIN